MRRATLTSFAAALALAAFGIAATSSRASHRTVTREVIAVYLGTDGTDAGMTTIVREMRIAVARQAAASGRRFLSRGVSLEPSVDAGLRHLALLGRFDEVSVGGNWTNSSVVRYFGADLSDTRIAVIPQVVLLEREVQQDDATLHVGPERELARYIGAGEIDSWVRRGALLPR